MTLLLDHVLAELRGEQAVLGLKAIEPIEALADLETVAVARPACFVLPAAEDYLTTQEGSGLINIEVTSRIDVVVMVDGALKLGRRQNELVQLSHDIRDLLFGWTPDAAVWRPLVPEAARLLGVGGGRASYLTRFRTVSRIRRQGVL